MINLSQVINCDSHTKHEYEVSSTTKIEKSKLVLYNHRLVDLVID